MSGYEQDAKQFVLGTMPPSLQPLWEDPRYLQYANTLATQCVVVTITGNAGAGKDALAHYLMTQLHACEILPFNWYFFRSFAKLKGLQPSEYESFKRVTIGYAKDGTAITGRDLLVAFGDFIEEAYGTPNICVDYARAAIAITPRVVINSSVRRPWEYEFLQAAGAYNIHIDSVCENGVAPNSVNTAHITEQVDVYRAKADVVINNNYVLDELGRKVYNAPIHLNSAVNKILSEIKLRQQQLSKGLIPTRK